MKAIFDINQIVYYPHIPTSDLVQQTRQGQIKEIKITEFYVIYFIEDCSIPARTRWINQSILVAMNSYRNSW